MQFLRQLIPLPPYVFRLALLLTALANMFGNILILFLYEPVFDWLDVPLPIDVYNFVFVAGFSFTVGVLALLVFLNPEKNVHLLIIGIVGKGIYSFVTLYFYVFNELHWFYLIFGVWDGLFVVVFFLYLIHLLSPDISRLNRGDIFIGLDTERTKKALILKFSLTGTGNSAIERLKIGLEGQGYAVDVKDIEPIEKIFRFPLSILDFVRIVIRAVLRSPARIRPLDIPANHDYDLITVEAQTWLVGISAPVEAIFQDPANRGIFEGRDVAVVNVCRGAWRRSQAMLVRWVQICGGNVVGARAFSHVGWEPSRLFSLWFYLIYKQAGRPRFLDGFAQPYYGLSDDSLNQMEQFGKDLAQRKRTIWHRSSAG